LIAIAGLVAFAGLSEISQTEDDYYVAAAITGAFFFGVLLLVLASPLLYLTRRKEVIANHIEKKSRSLKPLIILAVLIGTTLLISAILLYQTQKSTKVSNQTDTLSDLVTISKQTDQLSGLIKERTTLDKYLSLDNTSIYIDKSSFGEAKWFKGRIINHSNKQVTDIMVRLDLYSDEQHKDLLQTLHPSSLSVSANGADMFKVWIPNFPDDLKQYTFTTRIESAAFR
jgi:hypothetical protein